MILTDEEDLEENYLNDDDAEEDIKPARYRLKKKKVNIDSD